MNRRRDDDEWHPSRASWLLVAVAWTLVGVPLGWGIWITMEKAAVLFR
jgi:hypothetical protein